MTRGVTAERLESARVDEVHPGQVDFDGALRHGAEPHQEVNEIVSVTEIKVAVNASDRTVIGCLDRRSVQQLSPPGIAYLSKRNRAPQTPPIWARLTRVEVSVSTALKRGVPDRSAPSAASSSSPRNRPVVHRLSRVSRRDLRSAPPHRGLPDSSSVGSCKAHRR